MIEDINSFTKSVKIWNYESYEKFISYLLDNRNDEYAYFSLKIINTKLEMLGYTTPVLRTIEKNILKGDPKSFISLAYQSHYYEVQFILSQLITHLKEFDEAVKFAYTNIDNWGLCDGMGQTYISKDLDFYYPKLVELLDSKKEFVTRFALRNFFLYNKKEYIDKILQVVDNIEDSQYYVMMMIAWLLAEYYIKFPEEITQFFKTSKLSHRTINKAIQKIRDSYRVTRENKDSLLQFKRKNI